MKTTTTIKKIINILTICLGFSAVSVAQCTSGFTYTVGTAGQVNFTNTSVGTNTNTVYYWSYGDNQTFSDMAGSSPSHTYAYNGTYNVTLHITDSINFQGTCSSTYTANIVITNTATCNLSASFTYTVGSNGLVNFTNTSTGINSNMTISWNFGDGSSSSQLSPSHTFTYNGVYGVNLLIQDSLGYCAGSQYDTISITNTQNAPSCTAGFTYVIGSNGQVSFTNTSTGTVVNPTYSWAFGDGGTSSLSSPSYTYAYNGTYNVTLYEMDSLMNTNICSYTSVVTITNTVNNPNCTDSAYFYMIQDTSALSTWDVYIATYNTAFPINATWTWGDGTTSSGLYPSHTYQVAGWYTVCLKAYFACGDSSYFCQADSVYRSSSSMVTMHVINTSNGINQYKNEIGSVKLYPNPFADNLTMNLNSVSGLTATYIICDMYGNQLVNEKVTLDKGENKININTGNFSNGMYFVNILDNTSKKMQTLKVVK